MLDCVTDYQYIVNAATLVFGYFSEEYEELWSECMAFWNAYACNKYFRGGVLVGV